MNYGFLPTFCLSVVLFFNSALLHAEQSMLVLDASGSMWGQIDGRAKIDIARDALKELIANWPPDAETGLVVYGHREKGNCQDIEVLIPPGPLDIKQMQAAIDRVSPKGKTPLSEAVQTAANRLKFTEQKATVILLSDGKETCDRDTCALGSELEKLGVDFTAHVIGFDVMKTEDQRGLRCLAENTGGDFFPASDAVELNDALKKTVDIQTAETAEEAILEVSLSAPDSVLQGADFQVHIEAQEGLDGRVHLYLKEGKKSIAYQRIHAAKTGGYYPLVFRAPAQIGDYDLRFLSLRKKQVLAEIGVSVVEADIIIEAPDEAITGSNIQVGLNAPDGIQGRVRLYADGASKPLATQRIFPSHTGGYQAATLQLPSATGQYQLKFLSMRNEELAQKNLRIVDAEILLQAPDSAMISTAVEVQLLAPPGLEGRVNLFTGGGKKALAQHRVFKDKSGQYMPVSLRLPATPGDYVISFKSLRNEILAERAIEATPMEIVLDAPAEVPAATKASVILNAPEGLQGRVYLYKSGQNRPITTQLLQTDQFGKYKPVVLQIPATLGEYEIALNSMKREILAKIPIEAIDSAIDIEVPQSALIKDYVEVVPVGPPELDGRIQLMANGSQKTISSQRVRTGTIEDYAPLRFKMPDQPGEYIFRMVSLYKENITEKSITVKAE